MNDLSSRTELVCEKWIGTQKHKGTEFYLFERTEFTEQSAGQDEGTCTALENACGAYGVQPGICFQSTSWQGELIA
jgi:hypothetical protein